MVDFNNLNITGNNEQKQMLIEGIRAAQQCCDSKAVKEIGNVDYIFNNGSEDEAGSLEKVGDRYVVNVPEKFTEENIIKRARVVCHEISHKAWGKENNNLYNIPSKKDELNSCTNEEICEQNLSKLIGIDYTPATQEEIMNFLNEQPAYRCLPKMPPTSLLELKKVNAEYKACQKLMRERDSIFKTQNPNK